VPAVNPKPKWLECLPKEKSAGNNQKGMKKYEAVSKGGCYELSLEMP
jgi:hypothetical protein